MSKKDLNSGNGVRLEGYVDIELFNSKDHTSRRVHNTITKAGKQLFLHKSIGQMMQSGASLFGKIACLNSMTNTFGYVESSYIGQTDAVSTYVKGHISSADQDVTCGLLNLGTKQNGITEASTFIPSYDETGVLTGLTGFANNNVNTALNNEGIVDICKGEYCADPYTVCNRWKYDAGIASGTIDTLVMAPASVFKSKKSSGFRFMKCIEHVNIQDEEFKSLSTGFLPPNVTGYTGSNEILLNFDNGKGSRWKYNIDTGEVTAVPEADKFYVIPYTNSSGYNLQDYYIEGTYLYILYGYNGAINVCVDVVDLNTGTKTTSFSKDYVYFIMCRFLHVNNKLYINGIKNSSDTGTGVYEVVKSGAYYNSIDYSEVTYDSIGITLPSSFEPKDVEVAHYNDKYVLEYLYDTSTKMIDGNESQKISYIRAGIVFTSLTAIMNTITDKISMITCGSVYCNKGIIQIGQCHRYDTGVSTSENTYQREAQFAVDTSGGAWNVVNNRNNYSSVVKSKSIQLDNAGVWISLDGWWSDIVSFVKLNSPIEKGDTDVMYVSYGYKVVV